MNAETWGLVGRRKEEVGCSLLKKLMGGVKRGDVLGQG